MSVAEQVRSLIADVLRCPTARVTDEASLADDLGADSLQRIEIIWVIECAFRIPLPDEEIAKCKRVRDLIDLLDRLGVR